MSAPLPAPPFPGAPWPAPLEPTPLLDACGSLDIAILTALFVGGHLVEADADSFWISDNAHAKDGDTLLDVLHRVGIPLQLRRLRWRERVPNQALIGASRGQDPVELLARILEEGPRRGSEACGPAVSAEQARHREFGPKVEREYLDRDVALLVKGFSACGLMTYYSCAGHPVRGMPARAHVNISSEVDLAWADVVLRTYGRIGPHADTPPVRLSARARGDLFRYGTTLGERERRSSAAFFHHLIGPSTDDPAGIAAMRILGGTLYLRRLEIRAHRAALLERAREATPDLPEPVAFVKACAVAPPPPSRARSRAKASSLNGVATSPHRCPPPLRERP